MASFPLIASFWEIHGLCGHFFTVVSVGFLILFGIAFVITLVQGIRIFLVALCGEFDKFCQQVRQRVEYVYWPIFGTFLVAIARTFAPVLLILGGLVQLFHWGYFFTVVSVGFLILFGIAFVITLVGVIRGEFLQREKAFHGKKNGLGLLNPSSLAREDEN